MRIPITIRVTPDQYSWLTACAETEQRSIAYVAARCIEQSLQKSGAVSTGAHHPAPAPRTYPHRSAPLSTQLTPQPTTDPTDTPWNIPKTFNFDAVNWRFGPNNTMIRNSDGAVYDAATQQRIK